jgi:hypothetical protein
MLVLVWQNNYEKWQIQFAFDQDAANKGKNQPHLSGKYTTSNKGQTEWGRWSPEGLEAFNNFKKAIRSARKGKEEAILAFERKILAELRVKKGIDCADHDQQIKMNRAKRRRLNSERPVNNVVIPKIVRTVDEQDEDGY